MAKVKRRQVVDVRVNQGEPLDGSGRVCIHLFVQDPSGPFEEPHVILPVVEDGEQVKRQFTCGPARGRLACDPKRSVAPVVRGNVTVVTMRTDDPRAVTCPKCLASADYTEMMKRLESAPVAQ